MSMINRQILMCILVPGSACRSVGKGLEANIEAQTGIKGKLSVMSLDLSSLDSVKAFVREFKALGHQHLDVLVNSTCIHEDENAWVHCLRCEGRTDLSLLV